MLLVVIGLFLLYHNFRIQDILVELIGTSTPIHDTGVVHNGTATTAQPGL